MKKKKSLKQTQQLLPKLALLKIQRVLLLIVHATLKIKAYLLFC